MEKEEKVDHGIRTVFSIGGEEPVAPLRKNDPSVIAEIVPGETVKSKNPIGTEEIFVHLFFQYEEGECMDESRRGFKEKIIQAIYDSLKDLEYGGLRVRSVNARIPE